MDNRVCMFTGHRQIPISKYSAVEEMLCEQVRALINCGVREFITGGALGFDTMAAECVINLKREYPDVRLNLYLPCKDQDKRWNRVNRARYAKILDMADNVVYTGDKYTLGCMHERNRRMVLDSQICIAFLEKETGGTAYTVNHARLSGNVVFNLDEQITDKTIYII